MPSDTALTETLAATGATTSDVFGTKVDLILANTWTGTAALERFISGSWVATGDSWTANTQLVLESATPWRWRINFTRTTGSLDVIMRAAL